ncbi:MAG: hypothetical protein EAZ58_11605 [Flavobacterium sp.]|nr:MAG: hypothetical protein EAZ58_11605 [Flavobacterium sp.]
MLYNFVLLRDFFVLLSGKKTQCSLSKLFNDLKCLIWFKKKQHNSQGITQRMQNSYGSYVLKI